MTKHAMYLRRANEAAKKARAAGNTPFGAVLVNGQGEVVMEQGNAEHDLGDATAHAEMTLASRPSRAYSKDYLKDCTLYTTCEPCPMCTGGIYWTGIGHIVYGITEARLLELMEQAEPMSDLLDIEERLTEVRYQLEDYTSTLRLYDNQVDYATVELRVNEMEKYTPAEQRGFWQKITDGLSDSIVDLGHAIVDFISWLIIDLPYLLVIALLAWLATALTRRCLRSKKAKKQAKAEAKENEEK